MGEQVHSDVDSEGFSMVLFFTFIEVSVLFLLCLNLSSSTDLMTGYGERCTRSGSTEPGLSRSGMSGPS